MIGNGTRRWFLFWAALSAASPAGAREPKPAAAVTASGSPSSGPAEFPAGGVEVTEARDAFLRGSALARAGDWEGALAAFQRSARLKPHPVTTYDIAYCERVLGRYARASFRFEEALAVPAGARAPALPPELARDAETYLEEVRRRVVRVTVTLASANTTIRVDGRELLRMSPAGGGTVYVVGESDAATSGLGPGSIELWLDPGAHVFVLTGAADARTVESRSFLGGERATLVLSLPPAPPTTAPKREEPAPPRAKPPGSRDLTAAYIAFGIGGVGLVGGAVFAGLALGEKRSLDADPACPQKQCPPGYEDRVSRMYTYADLATAGLVTLIVGASAGTYFLLTAKPKSTSVQVVPWFVGTAAGVAGRF
jgi:hypothetical protein